MNCKPGDLAILVRDPVAANIGRIVEVVGPPTCLLDAPAWHVVSTGMPMIVLNVDTRLPYHDNEGDVYDADLVPVSGLPLTDDIPDEVTA